MFRFLFALVCLSSLTSFARAQLIAYEGFDYAEGETLRGRRGGLGWNGPWFAADGADGLRIAAEGMKFPGLVVVGGKSLQDGYDTRLFRNLDVDRPEVAGLVEPGAAGKTFGRDGTTVWIAFTIANTSFPKQAHGGMHLMDGVELGPTYKKTQRIQLGRRNLGEHWLLCRTDQGGPAAGAWDGTVVSDSKPRLLVYRFEFRPGKERACMWVDPTPDRTPSDDAADLRADDVADFRFDAVNVGSGGGATFDFDELRIATTFAAAAPHTGP